MNPETVTILREPFPPEAIDKLPKGKEDKSKRTKCRTCGGYHDPSMFHLDYVGHAQTTSRLLDADPEWTWEPMGREESGNPALVRDSNGAPIGLWILLTVDGVTRPGFGELPASKGADGIKEAIGDAIRNAAMRFGVALDLWAKGELAHTDVEVSSAPTQGGTEDGASESRPVSPPTSSGSDAPPTSEPEGDHGEGSPSGEEDDGLLRLPKADRARIRSAFMARISGLGLDYEGQVKPWLQWKYELPEGEGWSALTDDQAHSLYEALIVPKGSKREKDDAAERFKTVILEHQEAAA